MEDDPYKPQALNLKEGKLRDFLREKIGPITDQIEEIEASSQKLLQVAQAVFLLSQDDVHLHQQGLREIVPFFQEGRGWLRANANLKWSY